MGKASRSSSKKAVKRSRREILIQTCQSIKEAEVQKQAILQKILDAPKPKFEARDDGSRELSVQDSNKMIEDTNDTDKPVVNVTLMNSQRRQKKRARYLHRNPRLHTFLVTECEKKRIAKDRARSDSAAMIESNLGLRKETNGEEKVVTMHDMKPASTTQQIKRIKKSLPPGSQWLKIKKLTTGKQSHNRRTKRRYKHVLKGITQYYPAKKDEIMKDAEEQT